MSKNDRMIAYKGFDMNLCCRDKQYEIGKEYFHDRELIPCISGLHACFDPLDVFQYYAPGVSRYCEVEIGGETIEDEDDYEVCCERIKILRELTLEDFVELAVGYGKEENREHTQEDRAISLATEHCSASSATGNGSVSISTGTCSISSTTGYGSISSATGRWSASTSTRDWSASSSTGEWSASIVTGDGSSASVSGRDSVACALGGKCKARASAGSWISIVERNDKGEILNMRCGKAGRDIEPDTFYKLVDGEFVQAN